MDRAISTCFGIGLIPRGGGTVAAIFCCICLYIIPLSGAGLTPFMSLLLAGLLTITGTWSSGKVEKYWGKDNYRVVIDEFAGMWITMLFVPVTFMTLGIGLILFRVFDIWKPLFIRNMERLPGGVGVMMDDVLAGLYSCVILHVLLLTKIIE